MLLRHPANAVILLGMPWSTGNELIGPMLLDPKCCLSPVEAADQDLPGAAKRTISHHLWGSATAGSVIDRPPSAHHPRSESSTEDSTAPPANIEAIWAIGARALQGTPPVDYLMDGAIDDVRIYGRALSAAEVQALDRR